MRISISLPNELSSASKGRAVPDVPADQRRLTAAPSAAAFRANGQGRGWAWLLDHQLVGSVPAFMRVRNAGIGQRPAAQPMTESEERFRQLAQSVSDVLWIYEPQGKRFLYVSPAYEREWMRNAKTLYADSHEWLSAVHCDDRKPLQDAFDRLARGDGYTLEYRVTTSSGEERWIGERAFPVDSRSGQLARIAGVSQDITARKKAELELLGSDRRKNEFLAMLAHELRNPLGPVRSAAALLALQHADGPAIEQKAISIIERQVDHLTRLVDDLLDVGRINHGKIRLRSEVVRLDEVIGAAIDANRALAEKSRLRLQMPFPGNDVWVLGDSVRLTQVFSNLLHNATKFSLAGGIVEISVRAIEGEVAVSVRDEGVGIAPDLIDSVFDLFMQDEQSLTQGRGGLGIGLAIVRSLVELHGGKVSVKSDGIGKGSEFVVTLATTQAPTAAPIPANV